MRGGSLFGPSLGSTLQWLPDHGCQLASRKTTYTSSGVCLTMASIPRTCAVISMDHIGLVKYLLSWCSISQLASLTSHDTYITWYLHHMILTSQDTYITWYLHHMILTSHDTYITWYLHHMIQALKCNSSLFKLCPSTWLLTLCNATFLLLSSPRLTLFLLLGSHEHWLVILLWGKETSMQSLKYIMSAYVSK
jgi:hypothetical protein